MITNALKRSDGNINYPGIIAAWSAKGKSNDDEDRAILKDLTGNGHDISLKGFAFNGMSGFGGNLYGNYKYHFDKIGNFQTIIPISTIIGNLKFDIKGLTDFREEITIGQIELIKYRIIDGAARYEYIKEDGSYDISFNTEEFNKFQLRFIAPANIIHPCNIDIEILPEYPDALVFDGVDDYGVNKDMPLFNDYTVITKRILLENNKSNGCVFLSTRNIDNNTQYGAFIIEKYYNNKYYSASYNIWSSTVINDLPKEISWQTKNSYNGQKLYVGTMVPTNTFILSSGMEKSERTPSVFYCAYLFDRSLDEQEIKAFIRKYIDPEYLLPSEIPTPDCYYDFSKGSNDDENRDTIKDYSGNGNDAVAHNFAWSGMSGYGGYNFINHNGKTVLNDVTNWQTLIETHTNKKVKFKISGIQSMKDSTNSTDGINIVKFTEDNNIAYLTKLDKDGEYELQSEYGFRLRCNGVTIQEGKHNEIIIEEIPEYKGALVFDGVNDYVSLDAFDSGFKTVFMKFKPINTINTGYYDQIKKGESKYYFSVSGNSSDIAFSYRNTNGKTYINGILNTSILSKDVVNKTVCIGIVNENVTADNTTIPKIGDGTHFTPWFANMALYKFLGFKEALTEEQIQAVIKKYNLLDGVDEIEVS